MAEPTDYLDFCAQLSGMGFTVPAGDIDGYSWMIGIESALEHAGIEATPELKKLLYWAEDNLPLRSKEAPDG